MWHGCQTSLSRFLFRSVADSANMISSLRLRGMSEQLADEVGLWPALDVQIGGPQDVGKQAADDTGLT